jgi:hypothetical protein
MKTIILMVAASLFVCLVATGQQAKQPTNYNSFLSFTVGAAYPAGDFASTSFDNENAGFAKTGYNINLGYGYKGPANFGFAVDAFYYGYSINSDKMSEYMSQQLGENVAIDADHWKYFGVAAGPALMGNLTRNAELDLRLMLGVANANSLKVEYQGTVIMDEDNAVAMMVALQAGIRYNIGANAFMSLDAGYHGLTPKFNIRMYDGSTQEAEQQITALNLNVGLGFRF